MAALTAPNSKLADSLDRPQIGETQANVADVAAATTAAITAPAATAVTITYTTDDPGTVADGAITFADGDAANSVAEFYEFADEVESTLSALVTLTTELRTDHGTLLTDIANVRTTVNAILDVLEEHGLMIAS